MKHFLKKLFLSFAKDYKICTTYQIKVIYWDALRKSAKIPTAQFKLDNIINVLLQWFVLLHFSYKSFLSTIKTDKVNIIGKTSIFTYIMHKIALH